MNGTNSKNLFLMILLVVLLVFVYSVAIITGHSTEIVMNLP